MTKTETKARCKEILNRYKKGEKVGGNDARFLVSVFEHHPDWLMKRGNGVSSVFVDSPPNGYPGKCFHIERGDGSRTDISYLEAVSASSPESRFKAACRYAIKNQVMAEKTRLLENTKVCAMCGKTIDKYSSHLDHDPVSFNTLVGAFLSAYDIRIIRTMFLPIEDNTARDTLKEPWILKAWERYHKEHATFQLLCHHCNLTKKSHG